MADYIQTLVLSESYIYISDYKLTAEAEARIRSVLESSIALRSPYFFQSKVAYELKVEEGSLKIKCTILGGLSAFLLADANFRVGVDRAYESAKYFAHSIIVDGVVASERSMYKVDVKEARLGVPGRLKRITSKLSGLSEFSSTLKATELEKDLTAFSKDIKNLFDDIKESDERALISKGLLSIIDADFPPRPSAAASPQEKKNSEIRNNQIFINTLQIIQDGKSEERKSAEIDWKTIGQLLVAIVTLSTALLQRRRSGGSTASTPLSAGSPVLPISDNAAENLAQHISIASIRKLKKIATEEKARLEELLADESKTDLFREEAVKRTYRKVCKRLSAIKKELGEIPKVKELLDIYREFRCSEEGEEA